MNRTPDTADLASPVSETLRAWARLQARLAEPPNEDLLDEAEEVRAMASRAGVVAWDADEREALDGAVRELTRVLRRAGRAAAGENSALQSFIGRVPVVTPMNGEELAAALAAGAPIVSRRLVAPHGRAEIPTKNLAQSRIIDCAFIGWNFDGVDLSEARIVHTVFAGCSFRDTRLTRATMSTCKVTGGTGGERAAFGVDAAAANFSASYLAGLDLRGARLSGASFSHARLTDLIADRSTTFENASIDLAMLEDVVAAEACFAAAEFAGTTLRRVDLRRANLAGATFPSARVDGARFEGGDLRDAFFLTTFFLSLAQFDATAREACLRPEDRAELEAKLALERST